MNDIKEILNETSGLYNDAQTTLENVLVWHGTISNIVNEKLPDIDNKILDNKNEIDNHINDKDNPHSVTKTQVGLGNVDNTSDLDKPISTATQSALDGKLNTSNVLQTTGTSTLDVMSQKVVTDELNKKANASDVESELNKKLNESSANPQTITSTANNTTSIVFKNGSTTGGFARFDDVNGAVGYLGFNENKEFTIIPEGASSQKVITYKTMPVGGVGYTKGTITSSGMTGFTVHSNNIYIRLFGTNNEYCQIFGILWFSFTARTNTPVITITTENLVTGDYNQVGTALVNKYASPSEEAPPQTDRAMYIRTYGNKIQLVMFETFSSTLAGTYRALVPLTTIRLK